MKMIFLPDEPSDINIKLDDIFSKYVSMPATRNKNVSINIAYVDML